MKLLSIVFSFRNEEGNIEPLVKRISTTMIRKVVVSSKFAHVKDEMNQMAEIMTHDKGVQDKIYIKNS
jgi:hypothetical protein